MRVSVAPSDGYGCQQQPGRATQPLSPLGCHSPSPSCLGCSPSPGSCPRAELLSWTAGAHLSLSSLRWSMFRGFRRSLRIFFFFSRSVCFFPPFFSD